MAKAYWRTVETESLTPTRLQAMLQQIGFPRTDTEERRVFREWWNRIPEEVVQEAARMDAELVFEAVAYIENPLAALDLYKRMVVVTLQNQKRAALAAAERVGAQLQNQLQETSEQLSCRELEVLRLKAEIYDLMHKKEAK